MINKDDVTETEETCEICGVGKYVRWDEADGPDDYRKVWYCQNCGDRTES